MPGSTIFLALLAAASPPVPQTLAGPADAPPGEGWSLFWSDEFNGERIDEAVWSRCPRGRSDWNDTMSNDDRLFQIGGGTLKLMGVVNPDPAADPAPFLTGGLTSRGKFFFQQGKVEIRARFKSARGAWPALWMMRNDHADPEGYGEIDLMEHLNFEEIIHQTLHTHYTLKVDKTGTPPNSRTARIDRDGWNTFGAIWDPERIVFTVNDQPTLTYPKVTGKGPGQWPFDHPFYLILSMQVGGKWVGEADPADYPAHMEVDWVRVWKRELAVDPSSSNNAPLLLAEGGRSRASIVVPENASPAVLHAAREVGDYLAQITGGKFPIASDDTSPEGLRIEIGRTRETKARLPEGFDSAPERMWIQTDERGVHLCGGGDSGTLFAAYRFLEHLGCRWLTPSEEFVPRLDRLVVPPLRMDSNPGFVTRTFHAHQDRGWGLKMGLNGFFPPASPAAQSGCLSWPRRVQGFHAYHQIVPASEYFEKHPEWSPLIGGKRIPTDLFMQLCVSAPGLVEEFAANVTRALKEDPRAPILSISPNDGYRWCECGACRALDQRLCGGRVTEQGLDRTRPAFLGDRVFWFANEVARRVAVEHPDRKLAVLAYVNFAEPPDTIRPEPNLLPVLCHYAPADYSRAISDPGSPANRAFDRLVRRWLAVSSDLMIYSYVDKSMWWRLPRPVTATFAADVKHLHALGVRRYFCQSRMDDWALHGPLYYVVARLLWDPDADPDRLAREWIAAMFGPAAGEMETFYASVESAIRISGRPFSDDPPSQVAGLYDAGAMREATAALERAGKAAAGHPDAIRRIAAVTATFRYGMDMIEGFEQALKWRETGDPRYEAAARAAGRRALASGEMPKEAAAFMKHWDAYVGIGASIQSIGAEEMKGGRRCWNTDETGPGDGKCGWATFAHRYPGPGMALMVEIEVWGESRLESISAGTRPETWTPIRADRRLSGGAGWETLRFRVPPDALDAARPWQTFGLGGGDSQIWISAIRIHSDGGEPGRREFSPTP